MMKFSVGKVVLALIITISLGGSCIFKPSGSKGVMSYRGDRVFLQGGGYYRVGKLSGDWQRMRASSKAISFYNKLFDSSITTDAFCGRSFVDRPLELLAGEMISALADREVISTQHMTLDEREALRHQVTGKMDGVDVKMDIVVVKKNGCNFDFIAVMPPDNSDEVTNDFEIFFGGFHY